MPLDMQEIVAVRKHSAGADSFGHTWPEGGAVVEMPRWQAYELLAIPGHGFELAELTEPGPAAEVTEPAPDEPGAVDEAPASRGGRGRRRTG
jgi:hypothetical protein